MSKVKDREMPFLRGGKRERLTEVTPALSGKDKGHHAATRSLVGELGRYDGGQRVITSNPHAHLYKKNVRKKMEGHKNNQRSLTMKRQQTNTPIILIAGPVPLNA